MKYYGFEKDEQIVNSGKKIGLPENSYEELIPQVGEDAILVVAYHMAHCPMGYGGHVLHYLEIISKEAFEHFQETGVKCGQVVLSHYLSVPKSQAVEKIEFDF